MMRQWKRELSIMVISALLLTFMPLTVGAVIPANNCKIPAFSAPPQGSVEVSATDETSVRYLGRAMPVDGMAYLAFPLAGMEFNVTNATDVYVELSTLLDKAAYAAIGFNMMAVIIDDAPEYVIYHLANTKFQKQTYIRIARFEQPGNHKIRVMKTTGPEVKINISKVAVSGTNPGIAPSTPRARQIEFVGDSITVSLDLMSAEESQGRYNEAWQGYAGRTAEHFGADVSVVAIGGGFLVDKDQIHNAHRYFYLGDPYRPKVQFGGTSDKYLWDFSRFTPDIVVVNLGTNLAWATDYTVYTKFYQKIRGQYANQSMPILFALGAMSQDAYPQIQQAVAYLHDTVGDPNVYSMQLGNGYNHGGGHPSWSEHQLMAEALIPGIEQIMGWTN